jgi:hypothetical protein
LTTHFLNKQENNPKQAAAQTAIIIPSTVSVIDSFDPPPVLSAGNKAVRTTPVVVIATPTPDNHRKAYPRISIENKKLNAEEELETAVFVPILVYSNDMTYTICPQSHKHPSIRILIRFCRTNCIGDSSSGVVTPFRLFRQACHACGISKTE